MIAGISSTKSLRLCSTTVSMALMAALLCSEPPVWGHENKSGKHLSADPLCKYPIYSHWSPRGPPKTSERFPFVTWPSLPAYLSELFGGLLGDPLGGRSSFRRLLVPLPLVVLPPYLIFPRSVFVYFHTICPLPFSGCH